MLKRCIFISISNCVFTVEMHLLFQVFLVLVLEAARVSSMMISAIRLQMHLGVDLGKRFKGTEVMLNCALVGENSKINCCCDRNLSHILDT